jgi:hypothetical protein
MKKILIFIIILFIGIIPTTYAQVTGARFLHNSVTIAGIGFQHWSFENVDDGFTQLAIPITFIYPYSDQLSFDLITSPAFNSFGDDGLSGLSDTRIRGSYIMMDEKMLLTFGLGLPTGKTRLKSEELGISSVMAIQALRFKVPNMGQGFDVNLGLAGAQDMGGWVIGGGIGYLMKGTYKPFDGSDIGYNPGDEINITLGADYGDENKLTGDVVITFYGSDKADGSKVFKSGSRILIQLRYNHRLELSNIKPIDLTLYLRERTKGKNEFATASGLNEESENSNGNQLELGGIGYYPYTDIMGFKGLLDLKFHSNNGYGTGGAFVFGIGGGINYKYSNQTAFEGGLKFSFGHLTVGTTDMGITGIELFAGINYRL